jgi:hypothetical protein
MKEFKLWLEFEETSSWDDITNDFANVHVDCLDGRKYGINVWTFKFLETSIGLDSKEKEPLYQIPPDLFVKELTRDCLERTIADLMKIGDLEDVLNQSIFGLNYLDPWFDCLELENNGRFLIEELERELHPSHFLYKKEFNLLAKRQDKDSILIELKNGQLCEVHLTWSGSKEKEKWPLTNIYLNKKDFWIHSMKNDIIGFKE